MENVVGIINILILYMVVRSVFRFFSLSKAAAEARAKNNLEAAAEPQEEVMEEAIEMVQDEICNRAIPRAKAYIVVRNDQEHYFCSWECRQKFISGFRA
ncbi:transcriptional regulator [Desulforamulus ruminis]|uniref:TRASH domain-containing protein n=1 Tax=Desulforamulus ruminis (strain ATCC 23193 / DSM 2154 / NCIMB 8452 / DL) TaxID=696281 RepID=F6DR48_DESRL|nr:TRASH domain-containing protein [Desulforamulus ruminis]AEG59767.1 TRASH domain-containing protein [Desulforamulus ruminis DSM 2154]